MSLCVCVFACLNLIYDVFNWPVNDGTLRGRVRDFVTTSRKYVYLLDERLGQGVTSFV